MAFPSRRRTKCVCLLQFGANLRAALRSMRQGSGCLMLAVCLGQAAAEEAGAPNSDLEQVRGRIREIQATLQGLADQQSSLSGQLAGIERQYGEFAKALRKLEHEVQEGTRRLAALGKRQEQLRADIRQQNQVLAGQLRSAYAAGRQDWLKLALNQEEAARASRMLTYYGYLNRARFSLIQSLDSDLSQLTQVEAELVAARARLESTRSEMAQQQQRLSEARKERQTVLAKLTLEAQDKSDELKSLQEDERRLEGLIGRLQVEMSAFPQRDEGSIAAQPEEGVRLPVKGPVLAGFGAPRMSGKWDGVLIGAPEGTPVRSVAAGRVAFADWLRGYGLLTIVDHGDGYMSLYAFNQSLLKSVGDWVEAGETIAHVGASGGRRQPGLYFGIREKGRPIDPMAWCARGH